MNGSMEIHIVDEAEMAARRNKLELVPELEPEPRHGFDLFGPHPWSAKAAVVSLMLGLIAVIGGETEGGIFFAAAFALACWARIEYRDGTWD